jgi:hypothetical protein
LFNGLKQTLKKDPTSPKITGDSDLRFLVLIIKEKA